MLKQICVMLLTLCVCLYADSVGAKSEVKNSEYDLRISHTGSGNNLITIKTHYCHGTQKKCGKQSKLTAQGVKIFEAFYENDMFEGVVKEYYENGDIKSETPYQGGKRNGELRIYYQGNKLKSSQNYVYHKREGEGKKYYPNGTLQEKFVYKNDKREGVRQEFSKQGMLTYETMYKSDKKQWVKRYGNNAELLEEKNCLWQSCY